MNKETVITHIRKANYDVGEFAFMDEGTIPNIGDFTQIEQRGGEGQGDYWYSVKHFSEKDLYVKVSGFYSSYLGTSFDSFEDELDIVRPVQKTITVYE